MKKAHAFCLITVLILNILLAPKGFSNIKSDNPGSIKGSIRASAGSDAGQSTVVANARLTLTRKDLSSFKLNATTDEGGNFIFSNLPAGQYTLLVEADGLPSVTREINLASGALLVIDIDLTVSVNESVTIREEEGLLSTSETTTSNIVRAETLSVQPVRADNYQSALPLTPGVVEDAEGNNYIKGARSGQSKYAVNGADITDPITGEPVFSIPLEAIDSIQIEENPYSAEYGNFTGGVTKLESKSGTDKFKFDVQRFTPTLHNVLSAKVDSFRPRVTLSGPIIKNRLYYLQSFEYRFRREYVPSLEAPFDNTVVERFNSFTQIHLTINKNNLLKFNFAVFPQKVRFYGLDNFNPAPTTPNIKQRGLLFSISEQAVFNDTSFLSSSVNYKTSDIDIFGQGSEPLTIFHEQNRGNYFADTRRETKRLQWQETYYFRPLSFCGTHSPKVGLEFNHTSIENDFTNNSILLRRVDNTLAQRIDFADSRRFGFSFNNTGVFFQDNWVVNPNLTIDAGLRYDRDGITGDNNIAPRFSFLLSPLKNKRTIVRGGAGIFYDRTLPIAAYFGDGLLNGDVSEGNRLPNRIVTNYAADGNTIIGSPRFFRHEIVGEISPVRSVRWSLFLDQGITKDLTLRFGYSQRKTTNDLIVEPINLSANTGVLQLIGNGRASYREFQLLASYRSEQYGTWNASYVRSQTLGDLNTADVLFGNFPAHVIRPNEYGRLHYDVPHRVVIYGKVDLPHQIIVAPLFEYRTGFPFSALNDRMEFVGKRNEAGRFPDYFSLDMQVTKGFAIKFRGKRYKFALGVSLFNVTNHFNPRDVQNNINSPNYGEFYNSLKTVVNGKFNARF